MRGPDELVDECFHETGYEFLRKVSDQMLHVLESSEMNRAQLPLDPHSCVYFSGRITWESGDPALGSIFIGSQMY